jgi:hypothetical protein
MKHFLLLFMLCLAVFSCRSSKQPVINAPPAEIRERIVERLVAYQVPVDSAEFHARFECDSLNNVILKEFSEYKTKGMESQFAITHSQLAYKMITKTDTVYIMARDSIRTETIPYKVEVPVEINKLTKWQSIQIKAAYVSELLILGWLASKVNWKSFLKT